MLVWLVVEPGSESSLAGAAERSCCGCGVVDCPWVSSP